MPPDTVYKKRQEKTIESCKVSKDELRRLCQILVEKNEQAADLELQNFQQMNQTDEEFEKNREILRNSFDLKFTVLGEDGEDLYGSLDDVFDSPSFPDKIKRLYVNSESTLKTNYNYYPRNRFELLLDFSKPKIFDFSILPSDPTPNFSKFIVDGYDTTWVHGVYKEIEDFFKKNQSSFTFIHKQSVYDIFIWLFALPFCFWLVTKLSNRIENLFGEFSVIIEIAAYIYIFIFTLFGFRILFHYARWIWPLVEFESEKGTENKHRAFITVIFLSIVGTFIYDIFSTLVL